MYENGFANIKLELSILKAWADKIVDISDCNEEVLRTASFYELLVIINDFVNLHGQISVSERAIKYLDELIKDYQENTPNVHKPFMDILENIKTIYNESIKHLENGDKFRLC